MEQHYKSRPSVNHANSTDIRAGSALAAATRAMVHSAAASLVDSLFRKNFLSALSLGSQKNIFNNSTKSGLTWPQSCPVIKYLVFPEPRTWSGREMDSAAGVCASDWQFTQLVVAIVYTFRWMCEVVCILCVTGAENDNMRNSGITLSKG